VADDCRSLSFKAQRPLAFASGWNEETLRRRASFPGIWTGANL
jgi:hypothetical protein